MIALQLAVLAMLAGSAGESAVALQLGVPPVVDTRTHFTASFTVTNRGPEGLYFKQPWKWAINGLLLQARDRAGKVYESTTVLIDISTEARCTFFKALGSGDSFTFHEDIGPAGHLPSLPLPGPGRYRLRWVYDVKHYDDESVCASGGWPIWRGRATSPEVEVVVR
jgi:hypothetical protein